MADSVNRALALLALQNGGSGGDIDLSSYPTKTEMETQLGNYATKEDLEDMVDRLTPRVITQEEYDEMLANDEAEELVYFVIPNVVSNEDSANTSNTINSLPSNSMN